MNLKTETTIYCSCKHFVRFEGALGAMVIVISEIVMTMRFVLLIYFLHRPPLMADPVQHICALQ